MRCLGTYPVLNSQTLICFNGKFAIYIAIFNFVLHFQEKLPPTDSRLRPDQRCLENGEYEKANAEKLRLEQRQRQVNVLIIFLVYMMVLV